MNQNKFVHNDLKYFNNLFLWPYLLNQSRMQTKKPHRVAPQKLTRVYKNHEPWHVQYNVSPTKDLDVFQRSLDSRNRFQMNADQITEVEPQHLILQKTQKNSHGLPRISSGGPSGGHPREEPPASAAASHQNSQPTNHSLSQEFEVHHANNTTHLANKRPSKRHARRIKYINGKNQKIVDDRYFLQRLAMNYYGSRPANYLARDGSKAGQTGKTQQIMALLQRRSIYQNKLVAKHQQRTTTDPKAMKQFQRERQRLDNLKSQMIGKLEQKRSQRRRDLQKLAVDAVVYTAGDPQKSEEQVLEEQRKAMEEFEQMEVKKLKEQIQHEKEQVIAYWKMLQDGVDLEDEELAQIMKDLSDNESEQSSSSGKEATRKDDDDVSVREQDLIGESEASQEVQKYVESQDNSSVAETQLPQGEKTVDRSQLNDYHPIPMKRNRSTPFYRNMSTQKSKERTQNDFMLRRMQPMNVLTNATPFNPYKSTTPKGRKKERLPESATKKEPQVQYSNLGEYSVAKVNQTSQQSKRKASMAVGLPLKQQRPRVSESNKDLVRENNSNFQQRGLVASLPNQPKTHLGSVPTAISSAKVAKVPLSKSQLDQQKQRRNNMKQHLTPVQVNKKTIDATAKTDPAANTTVIRERDQNQKPKLVSDAQYVLPQLKREQIVFAKKEPNQSEFKKTEPAQFYRSQEVDSAQRETKLRSSLNASEQNHSIDKAAAPQEQNSQTAKAAAQNNRAADRRILPNNKAGSHRNDRYKEQTKGYEKLKLKYGSETQNGKESRPSEGAKSKAEAPETVKRSSSPNKKDTTHAQSLTNANAVKLITSKEQNSAHLTIKPKFIRHQNSIHEEKEVKVQHNMHYQSQFSEMYNSLGPYGVPGNKERALGQQRSHRKDLMQDSLLAAASAEEANQDLLIPRDKSHIASDSLMARLKLNERQLLNQRERDKIRAQSKYRARKMLEEQKQAVLARRGGDYAEQPGADSAQLDTLLKLNHSIKTKRHMRSGVGLPQHGLLAHGTSLLKLLEEEDAQQEDTGRVGAHESSTARRRERKQVCAELLETQQSLKDFNLEIDAKYLEKDQTFGEMLQENIEAIPGFTLPGKQKAAQAVRGQDTIEAYTCYLKNLARSVQSLLGFQDRESETTRKFQNDLQPDGARKMLVQIRNQIHQDSGETKKFDEVKKLIGTDKPERRQKEKKKKYSQMQVSQMQEHHQTILVQIRNDIVGVGRVVNQYFYEQVENQWGTLKKTQTKQLPKYDHEDDENQEGPRALDKEIQVIDQTEESPADNDPPQQKDISRMIDVAYGLESNSALFNEKFLRTTMTQEQGYNGEDSKVASPVDQASSQNPPPEVKPARRRTKASSCIFNQEIQKNIEHLRHSYIDHLTTKLQQKKSYRTQSCFQLRVPSSKPHIGGPRDLRYSLAMNGDFKLQEADLNLAAAEVRIGDDESAMRASHSRIAPTEITKAAQQKPRLEKLRLREQNLVYSNIQLNQPSDRKMRQTTNTFIKRGSGSGDAIFPEKLQDNIISQKDGSDRNLSNQFAPNDKSETTVIRNAYGFGNNHHLAQSNPLFSQKMEETKYTQANWLLPRINIEGKQTDSEIECTYENLKTYQKVTQKSQQSGLLPDIKKIISDSQFLEKDIPAEAAVNSGLFSLKAELHGQVDLLEKDYLQNEELHLPSTQVRRKSRNYNEIQSKSELLMTQKDSQYSQDVSTRVIHINRSQDMIQIREQAPLKDQAPLKGNFNIESDIGKSNLQPHDSSALLTQCNLASGIGNIEVINIQNQAAQAAKVDRKFIKSSQRAKKRAEQQTPMLQMEIEKILAQQYVVSNQTSTKEARKRKYNSVERNSSQKSIGIMKMYIPTDMVVDNHRSQQDLLGAQETLTALIEMNNLALSRENSQQSHKRSLRSNHSNVPIGPRAGAYKQRVAAPDRKSSHVQMGSLEDKRFMNVTEATAPVSNLISKQNLGEQAHNGMNCLPQNAVSPRDNYETLQTEIVRQ